MGDTDATPDRLGYDPEGLVRLDEAECWAFLGRHRIGRIGLVQHQRPVVLPVNYAVDDRAIVFRTAPGAKLSAAARGAVVAFEVDEVDEVFEWGTSVIVHGDAAEVTDHAERRRLDGLGLRPWAPGGRDHVVRVTPSWVSGRTIPLATDFDGVGADGG